MAPLYFEQRLEYYYNWLINKEDIQEVVNFYTNF